MTDDLRPSRTVALFPFAVGATPPSVQQADLCRGIACYLEQRLGRLAGVQPVLQNLLAISETEPEKRGWLMTNTLWSIDQVMALPFPGEMTVTHVVQGMARWSDDELEATVEVVDLSLGFPVYREDTTGPPAESLPRFHAMIAAATHTITGSESSARLVARPPTADAAAMRDYLMALAWMQATQRGMAGPAPAFSFLLRAMDKDANFHEAVATMEQFAALCLASEGHAGDAATALERAREAPWATPRMDAMLGLHHAAAGDAARAAELLEAYVAREPRGELASRAFLALSSIYSTRLESARAARLAEAAVSANPDSPIAWEELARHHSAGGRLRQAEDCLRRALQEDPDRPATLALLAERHSARGDDAGALKLLARAHRLAETPRAARLQMLDAYIRLGRVEEGNEFATAMTEENADDPELWRRLAEIRRRLGDLDAARHCVARLRAVEGDSAATRWLALAVHHPADFKALERAEQLLAPASRAGRAPLELAARRIEAVAARHIDEPRVWIVLASLRRALGDYAASAKARKSAMALAGPNADALAELSDDHARAGDLDSAIEAMRRARELEPASAARCERLGDLLHAAGNALDARARWNEALALDPANRALRRRLEKMAMEAAPVAVARESRPREEQPGFIQSLLDSWFPRK